MRKLLSRQSLLVVVILAVAGGGAYWVKTQPQRSAVAQEPLTVEASDLNFGEVWEDKAFVWHLPIHNRGSEAIAIKGFEASCGCVVVEPKALLIPAGGTATVQVTLNLRTPTTPDASRERPARDFKVQILPFWEGRPLRPTVWLLQGRVRTAAIVSPEMLNLGELTRGRPFGSRKATVRAKTALSGLDVTCDPTLGEARVQRSAGSEGDFVVEVSPRPTAPAGRLAFEVAIRPVTREGKRLPAVPLWVRGVVREDVRAAPETVSFGAVPVGGERAEVVVLRSVTGNDFKVEKVEVLGTGIRVEPAEPMAAIGGTPFRVSQQVSQAGSQSGSVIFRVRRSKGKTLRIVVPVTYHGIQAKDKQ